MTAMHGVALTLAYFVGAIPIGLVIGLLRGVDVRKIGSGNIGATNVVRGLGMALGLLVFVMDVGKGVVGVTICRQMGMDGWLLGMGALFAVLGHSFSPYLGFKGGKGVATTLGTMLSLDWRTGLIALGVWFVAVAPTRYVSLGSILGVLSAPVAFYALNPAQAEMVVPLAALAVIVVGRHNENIERLLKGEENRFGRSRKQDHEEAQQAEAGDS